MEKIIDVEKDLTYRQRVLLKLLAWTKSDVFTKQIVHIGYLTAKEWKYCNSLVEGNCVWFGGTTTRKNTKERGVVHQRELGFQDKLNLLTHEDSSHRVYRIHRNNIKRYLLSTMSKRWDMDKLIDVIGHIENTFDVDLRNIITR